MEQKDARPTVSRGSLSPQDVRLWMSWRWPEVGWGGVGAMSLMLAYRYKFNQEGAGELWVWGGWLLISVLISVRREALQRCIEKQKHV